MGGQGSKSSENKWLNSKAQDLPCGSFVLDSEPGAPRSQMGSTVDQFVRFAMGWEGVDAQALMSVNNKELCKFGDVRWIRGFWAGIHVIDDKVNKKRQKSCILIDIAALYVFGVYTSSGCCSGHDGAVIRVPLLNIASVYKETNPEGTVSIRISWKPTPDFNMTGTFLWVTTDGIATTMLGELHSAIGLCIHGGVVVHVSLPPLSLPIVNR